jgi:S1-C subfamily serine protease
MIETKRTSSNPPPAPGPELAFTRTAVALLLLGALVAGALAGAFGSLALGRLLQRPQVITAASAGAADPAGIAEKAEPVTVAITMRGVKPVGNAPANSPMRSALGTGFVLNLDGYILTTSQVAKADRLQVVFDDGRTAVAQLVGEPDKATGLAVLKVSAPVPVPPAFGKVSRLRIGETLVSMGTSLRGFTRVVGVGHVAALGQKADLGGHQLVDNLIWTDSAAPEGAAGGPVLNNSGQVIGVMVAPSAQPGGRSLVLPAETAQGVANRIIKGGSASQASLGIMPITITREIAESRNLSQQSGTLVNAVFRNTPAAKKLRPGDIITSVDGKSLNESRTLDSLLVAHRPGEKVNLVVVRGEAQNVVRVEVPLIAKRAPVATPSPTEPAP